MVENFIEQVMIISSLSKEFLHVKSCGVISMFYLLLFCSIKKNLVNISYQSGALKSTNTQRDSYERVVALVNSEEGQSSTTPPHFNGQFYSWWKLACMTSLWLRLVSCGTSFLMVLLSLQLN